MGPEYPCSASEIFTRFCEKCNKTFNNEECFNRHINLRICEKFQKCLDCGIIWHRERYLKGERSEHICKLTDNISETL